MNLLRFEQVQDFHPKLCLIITRPDLKTGVLSLNLKKCEVNG